ncbi:MAG: hypothetical protein R3A78_01395 [Polyangiales bacterium]|nr:hypothetical protein [Myxococcales bacterium]
MGPGTANFPLTLAGVTALLLGAFLGACGGGATHADFRAIQRHEATVERGAATASNPATPPPCAERTTAAEGACDAADEICDIADDTDDRDALLRCERARRACARARSAAKEHCQAATP